MATGELVVIKDVKGIAAIEGVTKRRVSASTVTSVTGGTTAMIVVRIIAQKVVDRMTAFVLIAKTTLSFLVPVMYHAVKNGQTVKPVLPLDAVAPRVTWATGGNTVTRVVVLVAIIAKRVQVNAYYVYQDLGYKSATAHVKETNAHIVE